MYKPYDELDPEEKFLAKHPHVIARMQAAAKGLGVDVLSEDPNPDVRAEVARAGYFLEELESDPVGFVRAAVAAHGGAEMTGDYDWFVRAMAASNGYIRDYERDWRVLNAYENFFKR